MSSKPNTPPVPLWDSRVSPVVSSSVETQRALDWWNNLPIQNLQEPSQSWVGFLQKYYPSASHPYHLTAKQIQYIYDNEQITSILEDSSQCVNCCFNWNFIGSDYERHGEGWCFMFTTFIPQCSSRQVINNYSSFPPSE